jgi:uncharacterized membrane protein
MGGSIEAIAPQLSILQKSMNLESINTSIAGLVIIVNGILTSTCQLLALFVIFLGVMRALIIFLRSSLLQPQTAEVFQSSRVAMGYSFSLGLSFLVGASILKTMISSRWDDIARLAAIIAVRTLLNYLLERAIAQTNKSQSLEKQRLENSQTK